MNSAFSCGCGLALVLAVSLPTYAAEPEASSDESIAVALDAASATNASPAELETIVITATRTEQPLSDVAARVEVVDAEQIERTTGAYLIDALKKNTSIDVIQYPGGLGGFGLRGFRPEFEGSINRRVLTLIDGRPAGVTNLGRLGRAGVARVEVLKGSASSLYGASAMGGVVNLITRTSEGPLSGEVSLGGGSFETLTGDARLGGSLSPNFDFDLAYDERSQFDDFDLGKQREDLPGGFVQGDGATRPNTTFENRSAYGRLGWNLTPDWRMDAHLRGFLGRNVRGPGAESDGVSGASSSNADAYGGDLGIEGTVGAHRLRFTVFATEEDDTSFERPLDEPAFRRGTSLTRYRGAQAQDTLALSDRYSVTFGADFEHVEQENETFVADGSQRGAFRPNNRRVTYGGYAELGARWMDERLIATLGARYDEIDADVLATPLRDDLTPGSASFDTFNPRAGLVFVPSPSVPLRLHASAGTGFVSPEANQLTAFSDRMVANQRRILRGNPDLKPEESTSYDFGVGYEAPAWNADLTWFRVEVDERIETVLITNTPELSESTFVNARESLAQGYEGVVRADFGQLWQAAPRVWTFTTTATYYTDREQELPTGTALVRNVARFKINNALRYDSGRIAVGINNRYVRGQIDRDFSANLVFTDGAGGTFEYPNFIVWDLDARWRPLPQHEVSVQADNLFDRYYYEKNDFPFSGRALFARYRYQF